MTREGWPELPALLAEIAEIAGLDAALKVADAKGGTRAYFVAAARLTESNWLVKAIGMELAEKVAGHLVADLKGDEIDVPLGTTGSYLRDQRRRREAVARALAAGADANTAARQAGITRRSVQRQKARARAEDDKKQGRLF